MALGAVLGQLAAMPSLPQKDRADYHDEAVQALQQAYACDPDDVDIVYNLALVQVNIAHLSPPSSPPTNPLCGAETLVACPGPPMPTGIDFSLLSF